MTESLGRAVLALETDASGLDRGLGQAETRTKGFLGRVSDSFRRLSSSAIGGTILQGAGLGAGISAFNMLGSAIAGASRYLSNAINDASNLEEAQTKVNVVFGEGSAEIDEWASNAADAFGQSKRSALEAVGTYGNLFQAFGIGREQATSMSKSLVELAADLASFNNTSVEDALLALRSGLSGETEPLKRYGVAINDARLRTELAEQGVRNLGATLTAEQKAVGAYALIMKDSALAQGDFARTSGGLANQQRILAAKLEDVSAEMGERLLPVTIDFITFLTKTGVPALETFLGLLDLGNRDSADDIPILGQIEDILNTVGDAGVIFGDNLRGMENDIRAAADSVGLSYMDMRDDVKRVMDATGKDHEEAIKIVLAGLRTLPPSTSELMHDTAYAVRTGTGEVDTAAKDMAATIPGALAAARLEALGIAGDTPGDLARALLDGLDAWETSWETMEEAGTRAMEKERRIRNNLARLTSAELLDGLRSDDDARRYAAEQVRADLIRALTIDGYRFGYNLMTSYAAGVRTGAGVLVNAAAAGMTAVRREIAIESEPKSPTSPLRGITKWGGNIVKTLVAGIRGEIGLAGRGAGELAGALVPSLRMPELGFGDSAARLGSEATGAGVTYQWVLQVDGVPKKVGARDEVLDEYELMMGYSDRRATL